MIQTIAQAIFQLIAACAVYVIWWLLLQPLAWLLSLPFILIIALFRRGDYVSTVAGMLAGVSRFWGFWSQLIIPFP